MSESLLTVESLRKHLPFLTSMISNMSDNPYLKKIEDMKMVIDSGKKLSPDQVQKIELGIKNLQLWWTKINVRKSASKLGSLNKNMNNENNRNMDVICISSDDEATSSNLPLRREHETVEIKTKEQSNNNHQVQEIIVKPEKPDEEIIMTIIPTINITPDTDSQKLPIKSERCEVETIIKEVKLTTDCNDNNQEENRNTIDTSLVRVKEEESDTDIDDYKTVYSGSSIRTNRSTAPEPIVNQTNDDDDDEAITRSSTKRKRRKISSSSEISDTEKNKTKKKRRRILHNPDSSDEESHKTSSTKSQRKKRVKSNSSSGSEFYSAESEKSSNSSVKNTSSDGKDIKNTIENFRTTILIFSENTNTTDVSELMDLIKKEIGDQELFKMSTFLRNCCEKGLLSLNVSNDERILEDFINITLNPTRQLRNRVIIKNDNDEESSDEESSDNSILDFSDDQDYQCYLSKNNTSKKSGRTRKHRNRELDKLKEDIDKSFIKPALLTLKPREHKKVDYGVDTKATSSDDSDDFVNAIPKDKQPTLKRKRKGRRRQTSDSSSSKADQNKNTETDQSEVENKKPIEVKKIEETNSNRTTPDNLENPDYLIRMPIEDPKNEDDEDNRSTPDIDLINDPKVVSFESKNKSHFDEDIDTDCSSGETVRVSPQNLAHSSDEDEDEKKNPKYHFITVEKIKGCRVNVNKLDIVYKPQPYKVHFENGVWKFNKQNDSSVALNPKSRESKTAVKTIVVPSSIAQSTSESEEVKNVEKIIPDEPALIASVKPTVEENTKQVLSTDKNKNIDEPAEMKNEPPLTTSLVSIQLPKITNISFEDNLFYDPISESESELNEKVGDQDEKPIDSSPKDTAPDSIDIKSSVTEEKYQIHETTLYDPISSDSEDDALHIDTEAEANEKESNKNKEVVTKSKDNDEIQHPVMNEEQKSNKSTGSKTTEMNPDEIITILDSQEAIPEKAPQKSPMKPKISHIFGNKHTLKDKLNKNSNDKLPKEPTPQKKVETLQQTPKKIPNQQRVYSARRKCSPMSKLLTENERKILNLSYISCRGGFQFRCINTCKYYNLREDNFRYHILSRHGIDKWAGFCNLCGKSYSKEILPLIEEYEHMIEFHIKPEHEQRLSIKENIDLVDEKEKDENKDADSEDDCIILSEANVPAPIAASVDAIKAEATIKSPDQQEMLLNVQNNAPAKPLTTNTESKVQQAPQNTESASVIPKPKQILRIKALPGDKLSGRSDYTDSKHSTALSHLNPEMTFEELTNLELAGNNPTSTVVPPKQPAVQGNISNNFTPPMTPLPEGCIPETTEEKEATLQAVIEENISRYDQPQQPVNIRAVPNLASAVQPNNVILHSTSNALVTYTPPFASNNSALRNMLVAPSVILPQPSTSYGNQQASGSKAVRMILPKPSYSVRPTATIAPSMSNTNTATTSTNFVNPQLRPPIQPPLIPMRNPAFPNTSQGNACTSFQNTFTSVPFQPSENPNSLSDTYKTRSLRPWLHVEDIKHKDFITKCFERDYLNKLYKCMLINCGYATDSADQFFSHLMIHKNAVKNPKNPIFACSYCLFSTENVISLVNHVTEKYSLCKYYCDRCFYRTCSQYNSVQHAVLHKDVGHTRVYTISSIPAVLEDQEFEKIKLPHLPPLKCLGCPQNFHTYDQFKIHLVQCKTDSTVFCHQCQKNDSITNLEQHQTNCFKIFNYNCCYCTFGCQKLNDMSIHVVHAHIEKIPFYIERGDISHLTSNMMMKAALVKKFSISKFKVSVAKH